jgi:glycosyltransferase involved in cell wall biosynthesis
MASHASKLNIGVSYYDLCEAVSGRSFTDIFLLPFCGKGGADCYLNNAICALAQLPNSSILVVLGEPHATNEWLTRLPTEVLVCDLAKFLPVIDDAGIDILALKLIQSCGADARLHVRDSLFGNRILRKFGRALDNLIAFYCFAETIVMYEGCMLMDSWLSRFTSEHFEVVDRFITDNRSLIDTLADRIGLGTSKLFFVPTLCAASPSTNYVTEQSGKNSVRILWASRLVPQKRTVLIPRIAVKLARVRPDMHIDVFGELSEEERLLEVVESVNNITYMGPYDHFDEVLKARYSCFIYTSFFDGIPTVILEAAAAGIPVIAPDVGGISEQVIDGETGVLLPSLADDDEMADAYVQAILRLAADPSEGARLARGACDRLAARHSPDAFRRALLTALGIDANATS